MIQQQVDTHTPFMTVTNWCLPRSCIYSRQKYSLVFSHEGIKETIICKQIVIATGSRPYHPQGLDFDHPRVFDSDKILDLDYSIQKSLFTAQVLLAVNMPQSLLV